MPIKQIEELTLKIAERGPSRADIVFSLVGEPISKLKKSTVLKATEICDRLFEDLKKHNLLEPCIEKQEKLEEDTNKVREEYEKYIASL